MAQRGNLRALARSLIPGVSTHFNQVLKAKKMQNICVMATVEFSLDHAE